MNLDCYYCRSKILPYILKYFSGLLPAFILNLGGRVWLREVLIHSFCLESPEERRFLGDLHQFTNDYVQRSSRFVISLYSVKSGTPSQTGTLSSFSLPTSTHINLPILCCTYIELTLVISLPSSMLSLLKNKIWEELIT